MVVTLILLSQFKYDKLMMTVNFVDLMIIDPDTSAFLFTIMPRLRGPVLVGALVAIPLLMLLWRIDPFRVRDSHQRAWRHSVHGRPCRPVDGVSRRLLWRIF